MRDSDSNVLDSAKSSRHPCCTAVEFRPSAQPPCSLPAGKHSVLNFSSHHNCSVTTHMQLTDIHKVSTYKRRAPTVCTAVGNKHEVCSDLLMTVTGHPSTGLSVLPEGFSASFHAAAPLRSFSPVFLPLQCAGPAAVRHLDCLIWRSLRYERPSSMTVRFSKRCVPSS